MASTEQIPVRKTLNECRELVFSRAAEVQAEYVAKGWLTSRLNLNAGIARGIFELMAWTLYAFYQFLERSLPNAFPLEAEEGWLDLHASQVDLPRRQATRAEGNVKLLRSEGNPTGNIRVPGGRVVRTRADARGEVYRFVLLESVVLKDGEDFVLAPVRAESYGQASNVTQGQICELSTHIPGIGGVDNDGDWLTSEGADTETDAQLQERYTYAWLEKSGCSWAAYASWALSVAGVLSVKILAQHPRGEGTVDVVVCGTAGQPTEILLGKVREAVDAKAPVNDLWEVKGPEDVPVSLEVCAEIVSGAVEEQAAAVDNYLRAMFPASGVSLDGVPRFAIGEDFTRDKCVSVIVGRLTGVKRLVWASPEDLVIVPDGGLVSLERITVTAREVAA